MTDVLNDVRNDFVHYVRRQLVGPFSGDREVIADTPNRRYLMGILFPRSVEFEGYAEEEGEQREAGAGVAAGEESIFSDEPVSAANDFLPASQGLSFFTSASEINVEVSAAWYETLQGTAAKQAIAEAEAPVDEPTDEQGDDPRRPPRRVWQRHPLMPESVPVPGKSLSRDVLDARAVLYVRWRDVAGGALVTVTLVNAAIAEGDVTVDRLWDQMLLQAELTVRVGDPGAILEYPSVGMASHDPEEEELRLQHQAARTFAIGHGCAVRWTPSDRVTELASEVMPSHEVPKVQAAGGRSGSRALDIAWLADQSVPTAELHQELLEFIGDYRSWVDEQRAEVVRLTQPHQRLAADRILGRVDAALVRMVRGAELLQQDADILLAFRLANEAMLRQMRHAKKDLAGSRRRRAQAATPPSTYEPVGTWYAFQLAFALLTLKGLADPEDQNQERDIVDLIWFPTGGGKTEAYLLLAAFEIFRRRIVHGDRGLGTAVISRYTLTLLTTQQFQRAATTICACEAIRGENPDRLGATPISIGLWVGQSMTPNRYADAREEVERLTEANEPDDKFLLERCPWCGTEIVPRERSEDLDDYGLQATDTSFAFNCPSSECSFHGGLPVHVVDDDLYDHPPSFLLGTVDKFAGLAWEPRSGVFFGRKAHSLPPTLIIQDELHLLTGPLGTTVGLYEAAIERLCENEGRLPKVVASTATIRRAPEQVLGLFGRDVHLFPPSGLSADDAHFAKVDHRVSGRLYVGLMAQGHTADTATVHSVSAMLQAPVDLQLSDPAKDAYWTLVAYHSSLRELGRTVTIARDDVTSRLRALIKNREVRQFDVEELTSNVGRSMQTRLLERLNLAWDEKGGIDFIATTNMLSVGVDIPRLGLMLMNGQPKATAEYIQATSRVGRDFHPGLVFSLFRATRPRDRSHYENFLPYHAALYRHVEPTSVTPFSPPSRDRSLHAALLILIRHHLGLDADGTAGDILNHLPAVDDYIEQLVQVVRAVEPREAARTREELQRFRDDWIERARRAERENKRLYYKPNGRGQINLIRDFNAKGDAWPTLRSMRNVDRECVLDIMKASGSVAPASKRAT
jgi:hypothetical protein